VRRAGWWALPAVLLLLSAAAAPGWEASWRGGVQAREEGRYAEAKRLLSAALAEAEAAGAPDERLVKSLIDLATLHLRLHEYAQAEPLVRRAAEVEEGLRGPRHPAVGGILSLHVVILRALGRAAELTDVEARLRAILARPSVRGPSTRWEKDGAAGEALDAEEQRCAREAEYGTTPYGPMIDPDAITRCIQRHGWHRQGPLVGADPRGG
jgi:hypothetical protein